MAQQHKIGKVATTIKENDGITVVRYYDTDVVKFSASKIILNNAGYKTATTKTRMNQAANQFNLEFDIFQKAKDWFVTFKGETLEFHNGMVLSR